jgi:hypothetical protein
MEHFGFLRLKGKILKMYNKSFQHRHYVAGQFLSCGFMVLLRKNIP